MTNTGVVSTQINSTAYLYWQSCRKSSYLKRHKAGLQLQFSHGNMCNMFPPRFAALGGQAWDEGAWTLWWCALERLKNKYIFFKSAFLLVVAPLFRLALCPLHRVCSFLWVHAHVYVSVYIRRNFAVYNTESRGKLWTCNHVETEMTSHHVMR